MSQSSLALITQSCEFLEYRFFRWLDRLDRAARYGHHRGNGQARGEHVAFGRRVEVLAAELLRDRGYVVALTGHKEHWDLWANGARVEVKAAKWDGRRWQWNLRGSLADIYLLACCQGWRVLTWFIVPGDDVGDRRHVAVWNSDPSAYAGQWCAYLEAWDLADMAIEGAGGIPWQMELWG